MAMVLLLYVILGITVVVLLWRLSKSRDKKERLTFELAHAKRELTHARVGRTAALAAAEKAEEICGQALMVGSTALEVRGHMHMINSQLEGLIKLITGPLEDAPPPLRDPRYGHALERRRGRHALQPVPLSQEIEEHIA